MSDPMRPPAGKVGQIETPMASCNVGKENTPKTHDYKGMPYSKGGGDIMGPGQKGAWKK